MKSKNNYYLVLISLIFGFLFTSLILGIDNLSPTKTSWITSLDTRSDLLALKFFINDQWRFPLGLNPNYGDITNSIVFSGAVPFLSFILKIFKGILPNNFHFLSVWIIICLSLQFLYSYKIFNYFTKDKNFALVCGIFFLLIPSLYYRFNTHLSLGAHWILFAYCYYEFKNNEKTKIFFIILSSLIHFYLTIMLLIVRLIFLFDDYFKNRELKKILLNNSILIIILFITMYVSGYFVLPTTDTLGYGFGIYKANLLTFFDPVPSGSNFNWSLFLPDIKNNYGEHEGFAYLGIGIILLITISLITLIRKPNLFKIEKKYIFLFIILLTLSLSNNIGLANREIINITISNYLYAPLSIIRASGRFIWLIYYFLIAISLLIYFKSNISKKFLILILVLQIIDMSVIFRGKSINGISLANDHKTNSYLEMNNEYKKIYSTYSSDNSQIFYKISNLLIKDNFEKTNIFRLGRYNRFEQSKKRSLLYSKLVNRDFDIDTLYVVENFDHLRHLYYLIKDTNHGIFNEDDIWFIKPQGKKFMIKDDFKKLENINFYKIKLNSKEKIKFKNNNGVLGMGWSHGSYGKTINNEGAWTEGDKSFLIFDNNEFLNQNVKSLILQISKVMNVDMNPLKVNIFLNKKLIDNVKLKKIDKRLEIKFDGKLKKGINEIMFEILNPITPVSKLESVDGRLLGFRADNFEFN